MTNLAALLRFIAVSIVLCLGSFTLLFIPLQVGMRALADCLHKRNVELRKEMGEQIDG